MHDFRIFGKLPALGGDASQTVNMLKTIIYYLGTWTLQILVKILFRLRVRGRENIPIDTGILLVARHQSYWDIPLIIASLGAKNRIYFIARKKLLKNLFIRPFIRGFAVPISRDNFGREDFRKIINVVESDKIVGIFPEGTTLQTEEIRVGVLRFAERAKREFLPIRFDCQGEYPPNYPFGFPRITARIGKPFDISDLEQGLIGTENRRERYDKMAELLMERVDRTGIQDSKISSNKASASSKENLSTHD